MLSPGQIRDYQRQAAEKACQEKQVPFIVEAEDIDTFPPFPFPFIGDYVPRGWRLVAKHFVDSSGFGAPDEPALTIDQFKRKLRPGFGYAVIEAGEFQVYIGEFKRAD